MHGVGLLIAGDVGRVSAIGFVSAALTGTNSNNALAGVDEGTAIISCSNVSVVIGVAQLDGLTVQCLGDFKGVGAFAQHGTSRAGIGYIRPIAVVPAGSAALDNDKTALVALGKVNIIRAVCIAAVVDDLVGAIALTLNLVLVIPASGDIPLQNSIPLENGELGIPVNLLFGLAVDLINRHLCRPFIVLHLVVVAAVGGNSNQLVATQSAGRGIKAVRDGDFIVAKRNICKLCPRRGDGGFYHTLCFVF